MSFGRQPSACGCDLRRERVAARPVLPVKALALPELTTSARALPPLSWARHHSTGADGHFERVNTPATVVPLSKRGEQHIGAVLVADAGLRGRKPHAVDRGQVRNIGGSERGDGAGHDGPRHPARPGPPMLIAVQRHKNKTGRCVCWRPVFRLSCRLVISSPALWRPAWRQARLGQPVRPRPACRRRPFRSWLPCAVSGSGPPAPCAARSSRSGP